MTEDDELLARVHCFEERALVEVYDRYSQGIYRYARRLLGDEDLAEECVAETFSRFLLALKRSKGPRKSLQAYLYRTAHNWITDCYRRNQPDGFPSRLLGTDGPSVRHPARMTPAGQPGLISQEGVDPADPRPDPHQQLMDSLERQQLRKALACLTPDQRQVIGLKYIEDWNNAQIAAALQKPVSAVKALQHRALARLRKLLDGEA